MTLLPEVRSELVGAAARRERSRRMRLRSRPAPIAGAGAGGWIAAAASVAVALLVAAVIVVAGSGAGGRHRTPYVSTHATTLAALRAELAILRRPQTAADRGYAPVLRAHAGLENPGQHIIPALTRLAATIPVPHGTIRVYVVVNRLTGAAAQIDGGGSKGFEQVPQGSYAASLLEIAPRGAAAMSGPETAGTLRIPGLVTNPLELVGGHYITRQYGVRDNSGVYLSLVPDEVTRAIWIFSSARIGQPNLSEVGVEPTISGNVASTTAAGLATALSRAKWFGHGGQPLASSAAAGFDNHQALALVHDVNASRSITVASGLVAHYARFRTVAPVNPATPLLQAELETLIPPTRVSTTRYSPPNPEQLNAFQIRLAHLTLPGLAPGFYLIPGAQRLAVSPISTADGYGAQFITLSPRLINRGVVLSWNHAGPKRAGGDAIAGLVPDGNSTVTLIRRGLPPVRVPVTGNLYAARVRGTIVAIQARDAAGRVVRSAPGPLGR